MRGPRKACSTYDDEKKRKNSPILKIPATAKNKPGDKKKRKNSPTLKIPESTTQHEETKKPTMNPKYNIPKLINMTKEQNRPQTAPIKGKKGKKGKNAAVIE